jgi:hypothetical protein
LNTLIDQIYRTKSVEDACGNTFDIGSTIKYSEGLAVYEFVREVGASNTLEIGMGYALSTLFICQAHKENGHGSHTAIDPKQSIDYQDVGLLNITRAGLQNTLRFFDRPSHEVLPQLIEKGEKFDFIFIDGKHLFDFVIVDFFFSDILLKCGGHLMLHDYWMPAIRKALAFILTNRRYEVVRNSVARKRSSWVKIGGVALNIFQNARDVFSPRLIMAAGGLNYCLLHKMSDDDRSDGHFNIF